MKYKEIEKRACKREKEKKTKSRVGERGVRVDGYRGGVKYGYIDQSTHTTRHMDVRHKGQTSKGSTDLRTVRD